MFKFKTPTNTVEVIITPDCKGIKPEAPDGFKNIVEPALFLGIEKYLRTAMLAAIESGDDTPSATCTTFLGTYKITKDKRGALVIGFEQSEELIEAIQTRPDEEGEVFAKITDWLSVESRDYVRGAMCDLYGEEYVHPEWLLFVHNYVETLCDSIAEVITKYNVGPTPWEIAIIVAEDGVFDHGVFTLKKVSGVISMSFTPSKAFKQAVKDDTAATTTE